MAIRGTVSTLIALINAETYAEEKRYEKAGWEIGKEAASYLTPTAQSILTLSQLHKLSSL